MYPWNCCLQFPWYPRDHWMVASVNLPSVAQLDNVLHGNSEFLSPSLQCLFVHPDQTAFLIHLRLIQISKSAQSCLFFHPSQAAWHDCNSSTHTKGHFCNTQLSSWKPQGSCSSPAGPEDMCHNLVKTCLSRLIQEHVASMGGSELWGENVTRFPDVQCETSHLFTRKKWTGLSVTQACLSLSCQGSVFSFW